MKKPKALHLAFNQEEPIIIVGDDKGGVNMFKLSNSLTQGSEEPVEDKKDDKDDDKKEKAPAKTPEELELEKMEKLISSLDKNVY